MLNALIGIVNGRSSEEIMTNTNILNGMYNSPECINSLCGIVINGSIEKQVRLLACVEMRKKVKIHWDSVQKTPIRQSLLDAVFVESDKKLLNAIARVISAIAAIDIPLGQWTELLSSVFNAATDSNQAKREVGYAVIYELLQVIAKSFNSQLIQLIQLFDNGLKDSSNLIQSTALQALAMIGTLIEPQDKNSIAAFQKLIPQMIGTLQGFLQNGQEDKASHAMEVFDNLVSLETPLLSLHLVDLVQFFLQLGANTQLSDAIRIQALTFLLWTIVYKKNKIIKAKLLEPLIHALLPIGAEQDPEDEDEDSPSSMSFKIFHTLAMNVSPSLLFQVLFPLLQVCLQNENEGHKKSALMVLSVLAEGTIEYMRNEVKLDNLLPIILGPNGLAHSSSIVRKAACTALASIADECNLSDYHLLIMNGLFAFIQQCEQTHLSLLQNQACTESSLKMMKLVISTLDTVVEGLEENVVPYLPVVMELLARVLNMVQDYTMQAKVVGVFGSAAHASKTKFQPYFKHVITQLQQFMSLEPPPHHENNDEESINEMMTLRAISTETSATIAIAVGSDYFREYLEPFMVIAMKGVLLSRDEGNGHGTSNTFLTECGFSFFAQMVQVFPPAELAPYLSNIIQVLLTCLSQQEPDLDDVDQTDMDDSEEKEVKYFAMTAIAEEKQCAVDALGCVLGACVKECGPDVLTKCVDVLRELCDHGNEGVRGTSMTALCRITEGVWKTTGVEKVNGLPVTYSVHPDIQNLIRILLEESIKMYDEEEDLETVSALNMELQETLSIIGPALIVNHLDDLCNRLMNIFLKKSVCQLRYDDEEDEENDDAEIEAVLISSCADLMEAISKAVGPPFVQYFSAFWPHLIKYYNAEKPIAERSMAIGVIGGVISGIEKEITPFTQELLQILMVALEDVDDEVRSNAAYATGLVCYYTLHDLTAQYPLILSKLAPLFTNQTMLNVTDNACGAISRLIMKNPSLIPLEQVLPVLFDTLPLKKDFAEYAPVFDCIFSLYHARNPVLFANMQKLVNVIGLISCTVEKDELQPEIKSKIQELMSCLKGQDGFQNLVSVLDSNIQESLRSYL